MFQNLALDPDTNTVTYQYIWMYITAPWFGSILAGFAHRGHVKAFKLVAENARDNIEKIGGHNTVSLDYEGLNQTPPSPK